MVVAALTLVSVLTASGGMQLVFVGVAVRALVVFATVSTKMVDAEP